MRPINQDSNFEKEIAYHLIKYETKLSPFETLPSFSSMETLLLASYLWKTWRGILLSGLGGVIGLPKQAVRFRQVEKLVRALAFRCVDVVTAVTASDGGVLLCRHRKSDTISMTYKRSDGGDGKNWI